MSLPHSKVLSVSKGFGIGAELYNNSPTSTQVVNVNINKEPECEKSEKAEQQESESKQVVQAVKQDGKVDVNDAVENKNNIINAYSLLLKIVENNPLIINKYIIAKGTELAQLIQLLTDADRVDINKSEDIDCHCFNKNVSYSAVEKIYIFKDNQTLNFKYSYPNANKILDEHRISVKIVIDE